MPLTLDQFKNLRSQGLSLDQIISSHNRYQTSTEEIASPETKSLEKVTPVGLLGTARAKSKEAETKLQDTFRTPTAGITNPEIGRKFLAKEPLTPEEQKTVRKTPTVMPAIVGDLEAVGVPSVLTAQTIKDHISKVLKQQNVELKDVKVVGSVAQGAKNPSDLDILVTPDKLGGWNETSATEAIREKLQGLMPDKQVHVFMGDPVKGLPIKNLDEIFGVSNISVKEATEEGISRTAFKTKDQIVEAFQNGQISADEMRDKLVNLITGQQGGANPKALKAIGIGAGIAAVGGGVASVVAKKKTNPNTYDEVKKDIENAQDLKTLAKTQRRIDKEISSTLITEELLQMMRKKGNEISAKKKEAERLK